MISTDYILSYFINFCNNLSLFIYMSIVLSNISSFFYQHRYVQCRCRSNIESCQLLQYQESKSGNSSHHLKRIEEFLLSYVKFTYIQTGTFDSKSACCYIMFVKLYIFLYLYSTALWTDQMHFPHNTFFPVRVLQPHLFWHPS